MLARYRRQIVFTVRKVRLLPKITDSEGNWKAVARRVESTLLRKSRVRMNSERIYASDGNKYELVPETGIKHASN